MKAVKTIAALIFLGLLATVLIQPVLRADGGPPEPRQGSASGETTGGDEEDEPGNQGDTEPVRLAASYPKRCMRDEVSPTGLVAARRGSTASIGDPAAAPLARIEIEGDVAWSPSGRYLLDARGDLFDDSGTPLDPLFFSPEQWQWSPVADCALSVTRNGNLTFAVPGTEKAGVRLVSVPVEEFGLSPNGRRLAFVEEGGGLWVSELTGGRTRRVTDGRASLAGWHSNRTVLFSKSAGSGRLRYATGRKRMRVVKSTLASNSPVPCGDRTLLVGQTTEFLDPLSEIVERDGRLESQPLPGLPAEYAGVSDVSCSPDGGFMAVSALDSGGDKGPLALVEADGTFVSEIMPGPTGNPTWTSSGLLFVKFGGGGRGRLWLVPPDGTPVPTEYTVGAPNQYDWHAR